MANKNCLAELVSLVGRFQKLDDEEEVFKVKGHFSPICDASAYIMDTFPIVKRKDEEKYEGYYRTKRVILEIYDEMAEAMRTGTVYKTRLDPPPGEQKLWVNNVE